MSWSLDFVADQLTTGRTFRILTALDTLITGRRLVAELDKIIERRGKPLSIVSNNGGEMTGRVVF